MRIRMIAFCLGLAVTPGLALTAHAQYDVTVLQDPTGATVTVPRAINASGQSVGWSQIGSQPNPTGYAAVLWSPSGKATVLQDVGRQGYSYAFAINDAGQSVGFSGFPVRWSPSGKVTLLQRGFGEAFAINDAGQSVGYSGYNAVLWSP